MKLTTCGAAGTPHHLATAAALAPATTLAPGSPMRRRQIHLARSFASTSAAAAAAVTEGAATEATTEREIPAAASRAPDFAPRQTIRKILADAALSSSAASDTSTSTSSSPSSSSPLVVRGWVRTCRAQKTRAFLELTDGSCATGLQVLVEPGTPGFEDLVSAGKTPTGASVECAGELVACPEGARQPFELRATAVSLVGGCDAATYPLQKKKHTLEFLRENAHLRPRTKTVGAVLRVRGCLNRATHDFFGRNGFVQVHTPIITASDCEGAGEAFQVTTLLGEVDEALKRRAGGSGADSSALQASADAAVAAAADAVRSVKAAAADNSGDKAAVAAVERLNEAKSAAAALRASTEAAQGPARTPDGTSIDYSRDFFGKPAFLTVSGQLQAEAAACALGDVYTFGPTFRAENSNTSRHLAEFWMIEPEMAFADLGRAMSTCEAFVRHSLRAVLDECGDDLAALSTSEEDLAKRLERMASKKFHVLNYTDAISELVRANNSASKKDKFEFEPHWGGDLAAEHERWLVDVAFGGEPVFITDWPAEIKAFYMKLNPDGKTVAAMDLLAPKVGELAGGSQREERLEVLEAKMLRSMGNDAAAAENLRWYSDLRRFGTVPHAGFGVGFERLVQLASGVDNIRDTIPFPRYPGHAEF